VEVEAEQVPSDAHERTWFYSDEWIIRPLKQGLSFTRPAAQIAPPTVRTNGPRVPPERAPATDLNVIDLWQSPPHPVATIPLKPPAFVGVLCRIAKDTVISVICIAIASRWRPPILPPYTERLSRLGAEIVAVHRIRPLWRQHPHRHGAYEPLCGKLRRAVVQILPFEYAHHEHLRRAEVGLKVGWEISRGGIQHIGVTTP
jgi:hypothetical protein